MKVLVAACLLLAASGVSLAAGDIVWCYSESTKTVRQKASWLCKGRVVSADEAKAIRDARKARVGRALEKAGGPQESGRALPSPDGTPTQPAGGTGTGFFVNRRGLVLTNEHVVRDCNTLTVTPAGRGERPARRVASDARRDLALLDAGPNAPGYARFRGGDGPQSGEALTVVGYPLRGMVTIEPQLVQGAMFTNTRGLPDGTFAMKIDVRRGNSGGPVLDSRGDAVGVVFAKVDTPTVFAKTGKRVKNVGLAVRSRIAVEFLRRQGVRAPVADPAGAAIGRTALLNRAREFVVQVRCWR